MQLPFRTSADARNYMERAPSLLLPISCSLALIVALVVLGAELGPRLVLIAAMFAAVALATRLPRVLPLTAAVCLGIAAITVLDAPTGAAVAAHAVAHRGMGN